MALTYAIKRRGAEGDLAIRIVDVTLGAGDYLAGGYALSAQGMGFGSNGTVYFVAAPAVAGGFLLEWVPSTGKLMIRDASGGVGAASPEVANALAALNGLVIRVLAFGIGHG